MDSKEVPKRMRSSSSSNDIWSQLDGDVFSLILRQCTPSELTVLSNVCSSWRGMIREYILWQLLSQSVPPWLIHPPDREKEVEDVDGCRFVCFQEKIIHKDVCKDFGKRHCIGSSHGWLILLDQRFNLYLLNPFSRLQIYLPPFIVGNYSDDDQAKSYRLFDGSKILFLSELRDAFFYKAILSSSPLDYNNEYGVILIYDNRSKLAYSKSKHVEWKNLDGASQGCYCDVICRGNRVYALSTSTGCSVSIEIWDFGKRLPVKLMQSINAPLPKMMEGNPEVVTKPHLLWNWDATKSNPEIFRKHYLVEYLGNILLVVRFVLKFRVNQVVRHHVESYQTVEFKICRFNFELKKWIGGDDFLMPDCALFLGRNHSISISTKDFPSLRKHPLWNADFPKHSVPIYYTDGCWDWIDNEGITGGHDMGIMGINHMRPWDCFDCCRLGRRIKRYPPMVMRPWDCFDCCRLGRRIKRYPPICIDEMYEKIEPPPLWVLPNYYLIPPQIYIRK